MGIGNWTGDGDGVWRFSRSSICGHLKEVAMFYFHDEFTLMKGIGLLTTMVGVSLFNWYKYQKLQKGQLSENAEEIGSPTANGAAKYAILENTDDQNDELRQHPGF